MALDPKNLVPYFLAGWLPGGRKRCIICGHRVWRFMPYRQGSRSVSPLMHALEVIGSDVDHFECPQCGAHDRERHMLMYLRASGLLKHMSNWSILHFAPEKRLSQCIAAQKPLRYMRCDLYPSSEDIERVDIQHMPFETNTFDLLLANHVLEHVDAPVMALTEIQRVIKPGGHAILQTPYSPKLHHTWEDPGIDTDQARREAHGQEDHVRLYGKDIFERFCSTGLTSKIASHAELLSDIDPVRYGVNPAEPLFLFQKAL
ncbi:biotin biosynthesis protein BioC [Thiorhodovibrio winogradskyi]|uniref:Biotin biosynthesis protein BioC n=1 Tax=Thiorhodovibrio winogradskyi TaxID=77007 RepID=A0ABZ0SCL1_9GAMM